MPPLPPPHHHLHHPSQSLHPSILPSVWLDTQSIKTTLLEVLEEELPSSTEAFNKCLLTHMIRPPYPCPPRAANISWKGNWRCRSFSITSNHFGSPGARSSSCSGTAGIISEPRGTDNTLCTDSYHVTPHPGHTSNLPGFCSRSSLLLDRYCQALALREEGIPFRQRSFT